MDRYLRGEAKPASFDLRLPKVVARAGLEPQTRSPLAHRRRCARSTRPARARSTAEIEIALSEDEARAEAGRCLDCGICSQCHECVEACPADAIHFDMRPEPVTVRVRSALLATGFELFDARRKPVYGYERYAERHHRDADGPSARADAAVQRGAAALRRQGAVQHRLRAVHRLARLHGGQPAVFAGVLHVLDQAGAAHHGRAAAGRRDDLLHRHPRLRKGLRRVLRAGQGHGRPLRQGAGRQDRGDDRRRPPAEPRGHQRRDRDEGGATRPGGVVGRPVRQSGGVRDRQGRRCRGGRVQLRARGRRGPRARANDAWTACSSPERRPGYATSPTPSCTPARRRCRWRPICAKSRRFNERSTARRFHLSLRRQHLRLRRRAEGVRGGRGDVRLRPGADLHVRVLERLAGGDDGGDPHPSARRRRHRVLLAQAAPGDVPRHGAAGRAQSAHVHPGEHPRAVLLGAPARHAEGDREGRAPGAGRHRPRGLEPAAREHPRRDHCRPFWSSAPAPPECARRSPFPTSVCRSTWWNAPRKSAGGSARWASSFRRAGRAAKSSPACASGSPAATTSSSTPMPNWSRRAAAPADSRSRCARARRPSRSRSGRSSPRRASTLTRRSRANSATGCRPWSRCPSSTSC